MGVVDEVSTHFIGSKHSFNVFFPTAAKVPYLKGCLAFSGNHKLFVHFWEGT